MRREEENQKRRGETRIEEERSIAESKIDKRKSCRQRKKSEIQNRRE